MAPILFQAINNQYVGIQGFHVLLDLPTAPPERFEGYTDGTGMVTTWHPFPTTPQPVLREPRRIDSTSHSRFTMTIFSNPFVVQRIPWISLRTELVPDEAYCGTILRVDSGGSTYFEHAVDLSQFYPGHAEHWSADTLVDMTDAPWSRSPSPFQLPSPLVGVDEQRPCKRPLEDRYFGDSCKRRRTNLAGDWIEV